MLGLYRDDGLGILNTGKKLSEIVKDKICEVFHENGLKITITPHLEEVDFLDIHFDIKKHQYGPYIKPNNIPKYVNTLSNHPPLVLKAIPKGINTTLSNNSSSKEMFQKVAPIYQKALDEAGYDYKLEFTPKVEETKDKPKNKPRI